MEEKPQTIQGMTPEGMFVGQWYFKPKADSFTMQDFLDLMVALELRFDPARFEKIPETLKRHFVFYDRTGKEEYYTMKKHREAKEARDRVRLTQPN